MNSSGSLVADGSYSIQFKLYDASSGGTNEWTGTYSTAVKNGYLSVQLGSGATPFSSTIDWSQEKWLTMNVNSDGEMSPRIKLTATPYSFRAGQADSLTTTGGTITGDNLLQKAPGSPQSLSSANAGLRLNQTGAGGLLQLQGDGTDVLTISKAGLISANGLNNNSAGITNAGSITGIGTNLTGTADVTLASGGSGALTLTSASGTLVLGGSTNTIQRANSSFTFDLNNAGLSTFNISNSNGSNLANLDVSGGILAGNNNAFSVNSSGDITGVFTALNGTSTANGASIGTSTSLTLASAANFDIGNYVQVNSNNCGGAGSGINVCYAKITNKTGNQLTITPALAWANGATVNEYHVPELGGIDTSQSLANRYGRGYFIAGVATGNGTTYYNEDSIETNLTSFDLLNTNATTINFGGAATTLNLGSSSSTVNISGNLATASGKTITASGGLVVSSGGISNNSGGISGAGNITGVTGLTFTSGALNLNSGGITNTGSIAGATTISASGAITAATSSNTINGLIINSGSLSGITGFSQNSGNFSVTGSGSITIGGGSNALTIDSTNFDVSSAGALSGITTIGLSGAITGATSTNTINGLIINSGALSGITGLTQTSGNVSVTGSGSITLGGGSNVLTIDSTNFDVSSAGALSGITTANLSGAITAATAGNTINSLVINAGSLSSITGFSQSSGNFAIAGTGTFGTGTGAVGLNGATTVSTSTNSAISLLVNGTTGTAATALQVTQTGNAANLVLTNTARTSGALISMTQSTSAFTGTGLLFNFASGSGSFASGSFLDFQVNGSSKFAVSNTGALTLKSDGVALSIQSNGGTPALEVNTTSGLVTIGTNGWLRLTGIAGDPASTANGDIWYNSTQKAIRTQTPVGDLGQVGLLCANTSVPAAIANSTTLTDFGAATQCSIPANSLAPGKVIRIRARGVYSTAGGVTGRQINILLRSNDGTGDTILGQTTMQNTGAAGVANSGWETMMLITVNSIGSGGQVEAQGMTTMGYSAVAAQPRDMQNTATVSLNTTLNLTLKFSAQWNTASNQNTIQLRQVTYEVLN